MKRKQIPPYRIVIDWSDEDQIFIARVPELEGVITHGDTQEEALKMAHEAIELHIESLVAHKEDVPEPVALANLKGNVSLRMGPDRHREVAIKAHQHNQSVNEYLCTIIDNDIRPKAGNVDIRDLTEMLFIHSALNIPIEKSHHNFTWQPKHGGVSDYIEILNLADFNKGKVQYQDLLAKLRIAIRQLTEEHQVPATQTKKEATKSR